MANLSYGDTIHLQNRYDGDQGGYLDHNNPIPGVSDQYYVVTAISPNRDGQSGTWKLESAKPGQGPEVKVGDTVKLLSMFGSGSYLAAVAASVPSEEVFAVRAVDANIGSQGDVTWQIMKDGAADGTPLSDGDIIHLQSNFQNRETYLDVYYGSNLPGANRSVYTASSPKRDSNSGSWMVIKVASASPQPSNVGNGTFQLPPNIKFGVTGLTNSSSAQTVEVFIGDQSTPQATLQGKGDPDGTMGTKVLNSGNGTVRIAVNANGKPSKVVSQQVSIPLPGGKTLGFGLVGSEDGSDNDYNDSIVTLNWPLG